jgi:Ca-activated chloride channel family protein
LIPRHGPKSVEVKTHAPARCTRTHAALLTLLCLILGCASARAQDDEVVRVESELVVLNVTVTEGGKYVHGLKRGDFRVFEDGVEQSVNIFAAEENPFAAAILLDTSGSMETRITLARAAAIRFLGRLRPDDVAAFYHFGSKVERLQDFTGGRDLPSLAYGLRAEGMTRLNDAVMEAARDLASRPETRRAIIVISDGVDTGSGSSLDKALNAALAANATIYTVNMTDTNLPGGQRQMLAGALRKFAERSGGRYVASPGGRAMDVAFEEITEELSRQYTVGYRPTNRTKDGKWRAVRVDLSKKEYTVRSKTGYRAPKS